LAGLEAIFCRRLFTQRPVYQIEQDGNGTACDPEKTSCPLLHQKLNKTQPNIDVPRSVEYRIEQYACRRDEASDEEMSVL
jgi:hypothetical protein